MHKDLHKYYAPNWSARVLLDTSPNDMFRVGLKYLDV